MLKTVFIGKKVNGATQVTEFMVMSGDKIVLVDPTDGKSPKKVTTKIINKNLHIFEEGSSEASVILDDYTTFQQSVTVSGIAANGSYLDYALTASGTMELGGTPMAASVHQEPFLSSNGLWGLGILAVAGGVAAAAGGGGGGSSSSTPAVSGTNSAVLVDSVLIGVSYTTSSGLSGVTGSDGSFSYRTGDTVTFTVGKAILGTFAPASTASVVTIGDLAGGDATKTANIAKFLQSLDSDTNSATITISSTVANQITTSANVQSDPTAGGQVTVTVVNPDLTALNDKTAPTAAITMSDYILNAGETATVTITFSEAVAGFSNADVAVQNGTLGTLTTADNITWTALFTPTANLSDTTNAITIASGSYTDAAGNAGASSVSTNYQINTVSAPPPSPTLTITDDENGTANIAGGDVVYTFTFGDTVTGFTADDITVTNGTKGLFSGSGTTYTLVVTPIPGFEGNITVSVPQGAALGSAGAQSIAAVSTQAVDMLAPTTPSFSLATDTGIAGVNSDMITSDTTINVTGILAGATWEYSLDSGKTWLVGTTPVAGNSSFELNNNTAYAINAIQVRQSDSAANVSAVYTNSEAIQTDTQAPIITVSDNEPNITANMDGSNADGTVDADGADITYTFKFDEAVQDFTIDDIVITSTTTGGVTSTITSAAAKTLTKVSDTEYTLAVTPPAGLEGSITVAVNPSAVHDIAGNVLDSTATDTLSSTQFVDMKAPVLNDTTFDGSINDWVYDTVNRQISFTLDSTLETVQMTTPDNFIVEINTHIVPVSAVRMEGNTVTLIMPQTFESTESIRVVYKDAVGDMSAAIQDLAGNDATSFTYLKPDVTPPQVESIYFDNGSLSIGQSSKVTLNFSEELSDLVVSFQNGTLTNLAANADDSSIWTATFTPTAEIEDLSNVLTAVSFHDLNKIANTSSLPTATYTIDTHAPSVTISDNKTEKTVNIAGGDITYTINFSEAVTGFTINDIDVVGGTKGTFAGSGASYTLVVTPDAGFEGDVKVDIKSAVAVDAFNNPNTAAIQSVQTVDTKALAQPVFSLKTDSGLYDSDGITNIGTVNVTLDDTAASWQYSLDSGVTWRTGSGTSFNLSSNTTYGIDAIQLRQYDLAGNVSAISSNSDTIVIDKTVPRVASIANPVTLDGTTGTITIAMDSELNPNDIAKENFIVVVNGITQTIAGAGIDGSNIVLNVASFGSNASVRVSYGDISATDDFPSLKDLAGNNAVSFTKVVADTTAPSVTSMTLSDSALKVGETAIVTIQFSEAVLGFDLNDLTSDGGVLSNLTTSDNITWKALFTPTVDLESTTNAINLSATYTDTTGVVGSTANSANYTIDTLVPTVTISDDQSGTVNLSSGNITYTFDFSESVSGFDINDIVVNGGTKGAFTTVSASQYTLVVTPTAGYEGNLTVDIAASKTFDLAGNANSAAVQSIQTVDMKAPSLSITDDESAATANIAGGSITYTFTFSENVTGFTADDITVNNGIKGAFAGSGSTYTLVVTPTTALEGDVTVSVAAANQVDNGGNTGTLVSVTQSVDMKAPAALTVDLLPANDSGVDNTDNITNNTTMTVSGVEAGATWEYSTDNGSTWNSGSGTTFSLANNTAYGIGTIQVRQTDSAGNLGNIGKNSEAITLDTKGPTLTITDDESKITANLEGADIIYTFTFDEAVSGFDVSDVVLSHGTAKTFTKVSDLVYTLGVTPEYGYEGSMQISVATTAYSDRAGNNGSSASDTQSTQKIDMARPTFEHAVANSQSDTIALTFNENLDAVNFTAANNFIIEINGTIYNSTSTPASSALIVAISVSGNTVNLVLDTSVHNIVGGDVIRVAYSDVSGNDAQVIQDLAGNDAGSFGFVTADISATDTPPVLTNFVAHSGTDSVVLTFNESLNEALANVPLTTNFAVEINGVADSVSGISISGQDVTLTLTTLFSTNDLIKISYTDPTAGNDTKAIQDLLGNDALNFSYTNTAVI
ncbi:MAG: Ig-like domain-containing protein [Sulfuricurvum sp.]|nr:Ig-like domain-containing protein [Sulfuricurvum sp.]